MSKIIKATVILLNLVNKLGLDSSFSSIRSEGRE